jgi:hypothetical protein
MAAPQDSGETSPACLPSSPVATEQLPDYQIGPKERVTWRLKQLLPRTVRYGLRWVGRRARSPIYKGDGVECAVCGQRWWRWVKGICPGCGAADRHRLIVIFLQSQKLLKPGKVLHFAAEPGLAKRLRKSFGDQYTPCDLHPTRRMEKIDATDIKLPDASVDGIITSHVLEHIPDDREAMGEMARVLKPGGWALVIVPIGLHHTHEDPNVTTAAQRLKVFGQHDHVRIYGYDVKDRLEQAGLQVEEHRSPESLNRRFYGLGEFDVIHFCRKP